MNILIQLSHPAHFHFYKNVAKNLMAEGHKIFILIKTKDILEDLLKQSGLPYYNILPEAHRRNKFGILWDMFVRDWRIIHFVRKNKIDVLTGSTAEVAQVGWLIGKPHINTGEDDMRVLPMFQRIAGPFIQVNCALCFFLKHLLIVIHIFVRAVKDFGYHGVALRVICSHS